MNSDTHSFRPALRAFTLIELLTVIAIMGILAALVISLAAAAGRKKNISRTQAELALLEQAIEWYKEKKGFYPPDNTNNPALNPLFYELTGTVFDPNNNYFRTVKGDETILPATVGTFFRVSGFANSSTDKNEVRSFLTHLKAQSHREISTAPDVEVLVVPVDGPPYAGYGAASFPAGVSPDLATGRLNPWQYRSSNPTNNPDSFELWADIIVGGKTNRISNWRKDPFDPN